MAKELWGGASYCSQFRAGQELEAVFEGARETPLILLARQA